MLEDDLAVEALPDLVLPEGVHHRQRMGGGFHALGRERLHALGMLEDVLELVPVCLEFLVGEREASEFGHLGDIDVDRHGRDATERASREGCRQHPAEPGYRPPVLPLPSRHELTHRLPRLVVGLVLFGLGVAMLILSDLGLAPWEVLHQGISFRTGIPIGTVGIITGALVLLLWIPLGERIGIGTIANVVLIGVVIDLSLWAGPDEITVAWQQWSLLVGGTLTVALGSGLYIGAGLGPGPRDGLMTGLSHRGIPIGLARAVIEITVLVIGWLLGGTVGIGTVVFAFGVGPLVAWMLPMFRMPPLVADTEQTFWAE